MQTHGFVERRIRCSFHSNDRVSFTTRKYIEDAGGVTDIPKTPDEFIDALKKITQDDNSGFVTNHAGQHGYGMLHRKQCNWWSTLTSTKVPSATNNLSKDYGDGTHPYAVYARSFTVMQLLWTY